MSGFDLVGNCQTCCGVGAQRTFEGEMKPLTEQLKKLEGIPVPDFGPLDDWAANRNAEMQRKARRAAGKNKNVLIHFLVLS